MVTKVFKIFGTFAKFLGPIGLIINAVQFVIDLFGQLTDIWSSDEMNIGEKIGRTLLSVPKAIWNTVVQPFIDLAGWVLNKIWPGLGDGMIEGIKSIGKDLMAALLWPFNQMFAAGEIIGDMLVGHSPSGLGLAIVEGLKAVGGAVLNFLVSPFKQAWELIKKIPFVDKLFGGAKDATASVSSDIKSSIEASATTIVEVKNLDALQGVVKELTDAVLKLGNAVAPSGASGGTNNTGVEAKLTELIGLLRSGAIGVNMDGKKVSSAMATMGT